LSDLAEELGWPEGYDPWSDWIWNSTREFSRIYKISSYFLFAETIFSALLF
jgi:hypothetical protein